MAWRTLTLKLSLMGASPSVSLRLCPSPIGRAGSRVLCRRSFAVRSDGGESSDGELKFYPESEILEDIMSSPHVYIDPSSGRTRPTYEEIVRTRDLRRFMFDPKYRGETPPEPSGEHANTSRRTFSMIGHSSKTYDYSADLAMMAKVRDVWDSFYLKNTKKAPRKPLHRAPSVPKYRGKQGLDNIQLSDMDEQNEKMPERGL